MQCNFSRHAKQQQQPQTLLATAIINVIDVNGKLRAARALLDSGSQSNLMTLKFCKLLGLRTIPVQISLSGVGTVASMLRSKCNTILNSQHSNYSQNITCFVVPSICDQIPNFRIDDLNIPIPENIELADPKFKVPNEIDILLGAAVFWQVLETHQIKLGKCLPILQKTKFGYIVTGPVPQIRGNIYCNFIRTESNESTIQQQISKFWEIEECIDIPVPSAEERECENYFKSTTRRDNNGKFIVAIPLKDSILKLGDSKQKALDQFYALEKRLDKNQTLKHRYLEFMQEYLDLGHMSETRIDHSTKAYYMPHHGVLKEENVTTKLRVVFNASAPTTTGISLNDIQMVGPTIQSDLFTILIRFREYAFVVCADISKMYRQIMVNAEHRPLQTIYWRSSPDQLVKEYTLNTVTYGTASAPFLAIRCLTQLAIDNVDTYPEAARVIREDMYVDDMITGNDDINELSQTCNKVANILLTGGFTLRKWKSNEPTVLNKINVESEETFMKLGHNEKTRTLGVLWSCNEDKLMYQINEKIKGNVITKRTLLSNISQIFDPLGLLAGCTIIAKTLLQSLWLQKISWDDPVPDVIRTKWIKFETELQELNRIAIPRYVAIKNADRKEIHAFCDASKEAFGACIYIRSSNSKTGIIVCNLLCAKTKVAPLKPVSIPRLELCAAVIAARLVTKVIKASNCKYDNCTLWSDSTIVLSWIKTAPNLLKCFVSNRVVEIQDLTKTFTWQYISTKDNPADILSRGISPKQISSSSVWWHGPQWLIENETRWPQPKFSQKQEIPEIRVNINTFTDNQDEPEIFNRFSTFNRMKRVIAYCFRFKDNCNLKKQNLDRNIGPLIVNELNNAFTNIIKTTQIKSLGTEYNCLLKNKEIPKTSNILNLNPFLDSAKLMRVGGRLGESKFSYDKRHPIILAKNHVTELLLKHEHKRLLHVGPQQLLYSIRERFWPISGKNLSRKVARQCVICFKVNPKANIPLMGNLPANRITQMHPFMVCGVDYGGPFILKTKRGRGSKHFKAYMALFVCFVSKAIHIELVTDLTKDAFLAAFRRFVARRGLPLEMHSDNGTNFVGANKELNNLGRFIVNNKDSLEQIFTLENVNWKFIPPRAPHMGGLWEAGIRSAKYHIKRVAGNALLTYEDFSTLLNQIEAVLNSRPLSILPSDPEDPIPLTPSHILIGRPLTSPPDPDLSHVPDNRLSVYQRIQQINQHFWSRWAKEYISELQKRMKWTTNCKALKVDTVVLLKEDNVPPLCWLMGVVTALHPGTDGTVRVATVRTSHGIVKRPVVKICPLPSASDV